MQRAERRVFFRWKISFPCTLQFEKRIHQAFIRDISLGGASLTGDFGPDLMESRGMWLTDGNGQDKVPFRAAYCLQEAGSSICGLEYERPLSSEKLIQLLRERLVESELLHRSLEGYFEYLIGREPSLTSSASELSADDLLSVFQDLESGKPLSPPERFVRELKKVVGPGWRVAQLVVSKWCQSHDQDVKASEIEEMTQGLLWGTFLLRLWDPGISSPAA